MMTDTQNPMEMEPTDLERAVIDEVLGSAGAGNGAARTAQGLRVAVQPERPQSRDRLLPVLLALQERIGWVSPAALGEVARRLRLPYAEAYGVASFYALLHLEAASPAVVHVCDDLACQQAGAGRLIEACERAWGPEGAGEGERLVVWHRSPCLGRCAEGPAVFVQRSGASSFGLGAVASPQAVMEGLDQGPRPESLPYIYRTDRHPQPLTERMGRFDPTSLDAYRAAGGYTGLRRALALGREGVLRELKEARLLGRGGAAFPTAAKWEAVAKSPELPRYVVLNADESEPGTFKDRLLLEQDPYAVLEGLTIAGWTVGATRGYIFLRGEYPLARTRLETAIATLRERGYLGESVLGEPFAFDVEVRSGGGAYVCGEETALFNAIEGKRGEPRNKPPFPTVHGLFGRPTAVNNVETIANVPVILRLGAAAYTSLGTADSTGTRLFCVSGAVGRPGLFEVPFGTSLGELLEAAGGLRPGRALKAILLGGAAGSFVGADSLDLPLSFAAVRTRGATLGSGAVIVFDDASDLRDAVRRIARFFRQESCGQCVPCRVGTERQWELVERVVAGRPLTSWRAERERHRDLAAVMRDASICGLGQTAANAIESAWALGFLGEGEAVQ